VDPVGANATVTKIAGGGLVPNDDQAGGADTTRFLGSRPAVVRQKTRFVSQDVGGALPTGLVDVLEVRIPGEIADVQVGDTITLTFDGGSIKRDVWIAVPELFDTKRVAWLLTTAPVGTPNA
jgi:hypothetical protein